MMRSYSFAWFAALVVFACSGQETSGPTPTDTGAAPDTVDQLDGDLSDSDDVPDSEDVPDSVDETDSADPDTLDERDSVERDTNDDRDGAELDTFDEPDSLSPDALDDVDSGPDDTGLQDTDSADTDREDTGTADAAEDTEDDVVDDLCEGGILCGVDVCCREPDLCIAGACRTPCDSGILCADRCCDEGDYCVDGSCTPARGVCTDAYDCIEGYFCETLIGACLAQPDVVDCEFVPDFEEISFAVEWAYEDHMSIAIPVVGDLDDDKFPDVVVNLTQQAGTDWQAGRIVVLDGRDGALKLNLDPAEHPGVPLSQGRSTPALGDVDDDGFADILYATRPEGGLSYIAAVNYVGELLWIAHDAAGDPVGMNVINGAISVANFDADRPSELVVGASLIDNDGLVLWNHAGDGAGFGSNDFPDSPYRGGISAIADLNGDGTPDIVSGRHAWAVTWPGEPDTVQVTPLWEVAAPDGYPAIADMDLDGDPDVVLVGAGNVRLIEGLSGEVLTTIQIPVPGDGSPSQNRGGPPTIADFDGDRRPEVGIAGGYSYTVYDVNREDEDLGDTTDAPPPGAFFVRWSQATQDHSSNATGSSVFDFQGDGAAEVVYADEQFIRVYDGATGTVLLEQANNSSTIHEYPLVVDVDADGNSEILAVANGSGARRGLYVYGDPGDAWVGTRPVWPQHTYHVTNATSAGNTPLLEDNNWSEPDLNNYRQNVQREGIFNAPDLRAELAFDPTLCREGRLTLVARVWNDGTLGVRAGVPVAFYQGDVGGTLLDVVATSEDVLPGSSTVVRLTVDLPEALADRIFAVFVDPDGGTSECNEANNGDGRLLHLCLGQ